ncbi:DUF6364 family protein [Sphingobacterium faecale]|uniref:Antitoxin n=1 Tax=Sphingobacterium faecale TaxID=2803775 RepID=A0ABS1R8B5_9SPHI|nr:DUF6364 family protein [Sphingobacterium faecale]MBL1410227.1 hypothetical protein [Sphingobacterium faecale]
MITKLTLTMEQSLIEEAKKYARNNQRSLSDIVESYLRSLVEKGVVMKEDEQPYIVRSLKGAFKDPKNSDYKKILTEQLSNKHC